MDADSDDPKVCPRSLPPLPPDDGLTSAQESNLFVAETSRAHGGKSTRVLRTRDAAAPSEWGKQGRGTRAGAGRGAVGKGFGGVGGLMETGFVQPDKILDKEYSGRREFARSVWLGRGADDGFGGAVNFDPFAEQLDLELGAPTAAPTTA